MKSAASLWCGLVLSGVMASVAGAQPSASRHQVDLSRNADVQTSLDFVGERSEKIIPLQLRADDSQTPCRVVYGYMPYWSSSSSLRWDLLTHIACFSVEVNANGSLANTHAWPWTALINTAHVNGVKVHLVATCFGGSSVLSLVSNAANRAAFFANVKAQLIAGNADGLNIDFEGTDSTAWIAHMPAFMSELRTYLNTNLPGCELTIAGPAVNWGGNWNLPAVAASCDFIFIMGYDFYGSWSSTSGPSAPLTGGSINITNTIVTQYATLTQNSPHKLVLGMPYYGNQWRTQTQNAYSPVVNWVNNPVFSGAQPQSLTYGVLWDVQSQTPWYRWNDGTNWRQVWFDNAQSIDLKIALALQHNLAGVGMWALGYDGTQPELWNVLEDHIVDSCIVSPDIAPPGGDGVVNIDDLLMVIAAWGPCPQPPWLGSCPADIQPSGVVDIDDLLMVIAHWS